VTLLVTAYSTPAPIVQPTRVELGLPVQYALLAESKILKCALPPP
jgi:hypothetical protein